MKIESSAICNLAKLIYQECAVSADVLVQEGTLFMNIFKSALTWLANEKNCLFLTIFLLKSGVGTTPVSIGGSR